MKFFKLIIPILIIVAVNCAPYMYQSGYNTISPPPEDKPVNQASLKVSLQGFEPNPQNMDEDTTLATKGYYAKVWNYLLLQTREKDINEQWAVLEPWLIYPNYKYKSFSEKLFLVDILSWASIIHLQNNDRKLSSLASFASASILHSCFGDIQSRYFSNTLGNLSNLNLSSLNRMQNNIEKEKRILSKSGDNIRTGRDLLQTLGSTAYYIDGMDLFKNLFAVQAETDSLKEESLTNLATDYMDEFTGDKGIIRTSYMKLLTNIFNEDEDSWPALRALNLFPDHTPLPHIAQMPRFYDYESDLEDYLERYKTESVVLAHQWLSDTASTDEQKARAFFILGLHRASMADSIENKDPQLGSLQYFKDYYHIRLDSSNIIEATKTYKNSLIEYAAKSNEKAIVLYNRIRGDDETPASLEKVVIDEINNKKYTSNEALQIYTPLISGLPRQKQDKLIDAMYNSYNFEWQKVAEIFYKPTIEDNLSIEYVKSILEGDIPWKKVTLVKELMNADTSYRPYISSFLKGLCYTAGDKEIIRRNLRNMYTKDITVGYNQSINWSAVNKVVNETEPTYRSMLILSASNALDGLPFNEGLAVIKYKFLKDDMLCLVGANWIVSNYDSSDTVKPDFTGITGKTKLQKATLAFLNAYFSETPNYSSYKTLTTKMRDQNEWQGLAGLGINHVSKDLFAVSESEQKYYNPVQSITLEGIVSNIKSRYTTLLNMQ